LVVALPLSQFDLTHIMQEELEAALIAACGGGVAVRVEEIANKPHDFKGGGTPMHPFCNSKQLSLSLHNSAFSILRVSIRPYVSILSFFPPLTNK
jgi:hypothetical protein